MPYVSQDVRNHILRGGKASSPGELNFQLMELVQEFLSGPESYTRYNDVLGVLTAMQHELYRRLVVSYEIRKCIENGDVFAEKEVSHD